MTAANASQVRVYRAFGVSRVLLANELVDAAALRWLAGELDRDPDWEFSCWADTVGGVWTYALDLGGRKRSPGHGPEGHGTEVFGAVRLKSGNTLIAGGNNNRVVVFKRRHDISGKVPLACS